MHVCGCEFALGTEKIIVHCYMCLDTHMGELYIGLVKKVYRVMKSASIKKTQRSFPTSPKSWSGSMLSGP